MVTKAQFEQLEKVVFELQATVENLQKSQAEDRISVNSKLEAILAKLSIHNPPPETETPTDDTHPSLQPLFPKMDLPYFDGSDALSWLARADQYFLVHATPKDQYLKLALIALSGPALAWMQLLLRRCPTLDWSGFSRELLNRFGDSSAINCYEALMTCKQTGSLEDYISAFESLISQLPPFSDAQYLGFFLGGLQSHIRLQIHDSTVQDYSTAIHIARKLDQAARPRSASRPSYTQPVALPAGVRSSSSQLQQSPVSSPLSPSPVRGPRPFRSMSDEEYRRHLKAGTCFKCGLKFSPSHRCSPSTLNVLVGDPADDPFDANNDISSGPFVSSTVEDYSQP